MSSPCLYATPAEMVDVRRRLAEHDWYATCFANLRAPADALLRHGITIPREKGFVFHETCPDDNTPLRQDPFNPRDHPCPTCGHNYVDEPYYRAWVTSYQMNLAQRAPEMGIVYQLTGDDAYAAAIRHVLVDYARHYEQYPLADCILGPTRLFQSTYIESLWLASLVAAADFVRDAMPDHEWRMVRDELFLPSARVILDYDEGDNNRQAMNNVALGFVGLLCDEPTLVDHAVHGSHGWLHHLEHSLLADGMWYEGDNYHFATLPAMLNLAGAMANHGHDLWGVEADGRRLQMMFDAPLVSLYPDLTMPARKDSRYSSPIGQRWHVGMYELAFRRYGDPAYASLLRTLYANPPADADCISNVAGLIDVLPSRPANRERLDWRGFLNAMPDLDAAHGLPVATSAFLPGTGLGVLRADAGRTYASVDYGHYGGGHGHPDRLQLNLYARGRRWLTDWGTGNYLFDHLRWYRSTVGHNTVVVDGRDQQPADGHLRGFDANDSQGLAAAEVDGAYPGVSCRRTVLLLSPDLLLDLFTVEADHERQLDWTIHPCASREVEFSGGVGRLESAEIAGEHYEWLRDVRRATTTDNWTAAFQQEDDTLAVHGVEQPGTEIYLAAAYGPPQEIPALSPVLIVRRQTTRTTFATLFEHRSDGQPAVESFGVDPDGRYVLVLRDRSRIACQYDDDAATATIIRYDMRGSVVESSSFGTDGVPAATDGVPAATDAGTEAGPPIAVEAWLPNLAGPTVRVGVANRGAEPRDVTVAAHDTSQAARVVRDATVDLPIVWSTLGRPLTVRASSGEFAVEHTLSPTMAQLGREYRLDRPDQVCRGEQDWDGPDGLSARFRLDRDGELLRVSINVTDDTVVCSGPVEEPYDYDSVQIYLDPRDDADRENPYLTGVFGLVLVPAPNSGDEPQILPIGDTAVDGLQLRSHLRDDGYALELRLPLSRWGVTPRPGDKVGFDLLVNDNDGTFRRRQQLIWSGAEGSRIWLRHDYHQPQKFGALVF